MECGDRKGTRQDMARLLNGAALLALAGAAAALAGAVAGGAIPLIAIWASFVHAGAVLAALAAWWFWRQGATRWALAAAVVLAGSAAMTGPALWPSGAPAAKPGHGAKILLFNLHWNNRDFVAVKALVEAHNPDIVVLQEVFERNRAELRILDAAYPYRVECWTARPCDTLILSRRSLRETASFVAWRGVPLGLARAGFELDGCPVTLFAAHLNRPWPYRRLGAPATQPAQTKAFADAIAGWPGPKIVLGDLNAVTWSPVVRELAAAAQGRALGGLSGTWPWFLPGPAKLPIDHVIVSKPAIAGARTVLGAPGSDHHAVLAELSVPDARACRP
jgi:endonuclease/exonuclease/phosphatase (EEP) superfamily protein YafD